MNITANTVKKFLTDYYHKPVDDVVMLSGGEWSKAFGYSHNDQELVIRFGKHAEDYYKDQAASHYSSTTLPIPQVLDVGKEQDGFYAISVRAYGVMLDQLDADKMKRIVPAVFSMLDAIREIKDKHAIVTKTSSWKKSLLSINEDTPGQRVSGWKDIMKNSPTGYQPFETAYAKLKELVAICPDADDLIHNDLLHFNVLTKDEKITAVIDWGNTNRGDFLYEIAWFSYWANWYPAMATIDWEQEAKKHYESIGLIVPNFAERIRCYKLHISLDAQKYNAFTHRLDELDTNAKAGLALL